ncbi:SBBP repeat-containing protein [Coleofasciculus sp.]|uniref:SBBP repeat-containing protein n=1 Tax=Coleofasciculus sp. TaxID=3100458 RepID=UPI003A4BEE6A
MELAKTTTPEDYQPKELLIPERWSGEGTVTATERAADNQSIGLEWVKQLGTPGEDWARDVAVDSAGNVYVTGSAGGSFTGSNHRDGSWIAKYDSTGQQQWLKQFSLDNSRSIVLDQDGNIYLAGGEKNAWLAKFDTNGKQKWLERLSVPGTDIFSSIAVDNSGGLYVTGFTEGSLGSSNAGRHDAWIAKYDTNGDPVYNYGKQLWIRQLGSSSNDRAWGIATDSLGNIYITGETDGSLPGTSSLNGGAWIAKYDRDGNRKWTKQLDNTESYKLSLSATSRSPRDLETNIGKTIGSGKNFRVTGRVYDPDGASDLETVLIQLSPEVGETQNYYIKSFTPASDDPNWAEFSYDLGRLAPGKYGWSARAYDKSGGSSYISISLEDFEVVSSPLDHVGDSPKDALNIGTINGTHTFSDWVGNTDNNDYYQFSLSSKTHLGLVLDKLNSYADLQLLKLNSDGTTNLIHSSYNRGTKPEEIGINGLDSGTYLARVYNRGNTNYNLSLFTPSITTIDLNQTISGSLTKLDPQDTGERFGGSFYDDYRLTGVSPGQPIKLTMSSSKFMPHILLLNPSTGEWLGRSRITNRDLDTAELTFTVPTQDYIISVTSYGYKFGDYTLTATSDKTAEIPTSHWKAEYFNNRDLAGNPVHVEDFGDSSQNFEHQWGLGSPTNTPSDNFSARITTQRYFPEGKYQINVNADDGVRVRIGNQLVIDKWQNQGFEHLRTGYFNSNGGQYPVTVEYYEKGGAAALKFDIESFNSFEEPASNGSEWNSSFFWWDKEQGDEPPVNFYENQDNFIGVVSLGSNQRSDGQNGIHLNLGDRFPQGDSRLPHDFFALRSYTHADFEKGKRYRILVKADDGFQLLAKHHWLPDSDPNKWVDITSKYHWQQAYNSYKVIDFEVPNSGKYDLHFHLYEAGGDAYMDLAWGEIVGNFMVSGDFYNAYKNRRELGNPTSEVFDSGNGTFKQNFEHGYIFWNGQSAQVYQTGSGKPSQPSNSFQTGRVNSQVGSLPLRLRNEPSTIGTTTLDLLYQGTTFKIIRQVSSSDPNWHSWYEVEANGKHGYVAADYVDVISNNNSNNSPNPTPQPVIGSDLFDTWRLSKPRHDGIANQQDPRTDETDYAQLQQKIIDIKNEIDELDSQISDKQKEVDKKEAEAKGKTWFNRTKLKVEAFLIRENIELLKSIKEDKEEELDQALEDQEIDTLARTIWGEARGESDLGKQAVGWVIRNRASRSPQYGWSSKISEVCKQPKQFSCWNDSDPNYQKLLTITGKDLIFGKCLEIARKVINGEVPDPTNGADHYYAYTDIPEPNWAVGKNPTKTIGNHRFYKLA